MVNTRRTTKGARTYRHHPLSLWSNWWWCRPSCWSRWLRTCKTMGIHPLKLETRGESFWKDIHLFSNIPLTLSKQMTGCVQLRGNLRLHNVMTRRKFCLQLGNCRGLLLTGESFCFGRTEANPITWQEFRNDFHSHHVPARLMKLKEFLDLK